MSSSAATPEAEGSERPGRLALLLAMAMFVLVVDTSLMNVSISAVVRDLDTTVSGVQSAIALEALVSAAFILIGSKFGDLFGRKRAYVLGLLGYAIGALAMVFTQGLTRDHRLLGDRRRSRRGAAAAGDAVPDPRQLRRGVRMKVYALVGAAAAIATAVGPLLGGFITTYLSWRVAFLLEAVVIAVVLSGIGLVRDVPYTGPRGVDVGSAVLSVLGMGGVVLGILVWQEGGESVGALLAIGAIAAGATGALARAPQAGGQAGADRSGPVPLRALQDRDHGADAPADRTRRRDHRAADLPADGARVRRDGGRAVARPALAHDVRGRAPRREAGGQAPAGQPHPRGIRAVHARDGDPGPDHPARRFRLGPRAPAGHRRIRPGPAGVPAQQLHALPGRGRARERGRRRELGGGVVRALVRARVRRSDHAGDARDRVHEQERRERRPAARPTRSASPRCSRTTRS